MEEKINWKLAQVLPDINNRIIVFDTETSGLSHFQDQILEIAAVEIIKGKISGKQFHIYLKPLKKIKKQVSDINHIHTEDFKNYFEEYYDEEKNLMQNFLDFIGDDSIIFAHNMIFDFYFLNDELSKCNLKKLDPKRFRCSMRIFNEILKENFPDLKVKKRLSDCCNYFNIMPYSLDGMFHNGLFDTIMTAKLICKLYDFKQGKIKKEDLFNNIMKYENTEKEKNLSEKNINDENKNEKQKENINNNYKDVVNNLYNIPYYIENTSDDNNLKEIANKLSMLSFSENK